MKYCNHCGKPLDEGAKFCGKCGKQVADVKAQPAEEPRNVTIKAANQNFSEDEQAEIQKMEKNLKNAGDTGVALGWFQIIITISLFLVGNFIDDLGDYQFGLTDVALFLPFSFMVIVLSKRVKTIRSIKIKKYLYILLVFSILVVMLSFAGGGGAGILWFIYLFYLYRGIKSSSKLEKVKDYFNENNMDTKIKAPHWFVLGVITIIFVFIGLVFDSSGSYTPEEFKENFISSCEREAGGDAYSSYCQCAHDYMINKYTYQEIEEIESSGDLTEVQSEIVNACSAYISQ